MATIHLLRRCTRRERPAAARLVWAAIPHRRRSNAAVILSTLLELSAILSDLHRIGGGARPKESVRPHNVASP
jgi:hypothetical protein